MLPSKNLLIDVLSILSIEIDCFIQAPSLEDEIIQSLMSESEFDYFKLIKINNQNRNIIINHFLHNDIIQYFQSIQLKQDSKLLFEAYDGVEYGIVSKDVIIPDWFNTVYISDGTCIVSKNW